MFLTEFDQAKYDRVVGRLYEQRGEARGIKLGEKRGINIGINQNLFSLVQDGIITKQEALRRTTDKKGLEELLQ